MQEKAHALYRFYDRAGALLYIGITVDPGRRFERHRTDKPWWQDVARVEIESHSSRSAVLAAERAAIAKEALGSFLVCPHCVDSGDIQELVWVNGKPTLP